VGVSQLVIGLTVVAYGTSTPELAVSLQAGLAGNADIAVANVVGSNICNVLFILGACAAMKPLVVHRQLVRLEVPIMIATSVLLMALSWDGKLGGWDGALLFLGVTLYTVWAFLRSRREEALAAASGVAGSAASEKPQKTARRIAVPVGCVLAGLAFLALGARWLVPEFCTQLAAMIGEEKFSLIPADREWEPAARQPGLSLDIQQPKVVFNMMILRSFLSVQENSCLHRQGKTLRPAAGVKPRLCLAASVV
jgi:cation:H+ antiporter